MLSVTKSLKRIFPFTIAGAVSGCFVFLVNQGVAHAQTNRNFVIVNSTNSTIDKLYLSPSGSTSWGRNDLGSDSIRSGNSLRFTLGNSSCLYDVLAVLSDGQRIDDRQVNTCENGRYTFRLSETSNSASSSSSDSSIDINSFIMTPRESQEQTQQMMQQQQESQRQFQDQHQQMMQQQREWLEQQRQRIDANTRTVTTDGL